MEYNKDILAKNLLTILSIMILILIQGCSARTQSNTNYDSIFLDVDNLNHNKFGLEIIENDESIGLKSIYISNNNIFIVDTYHNNFKMIDIINKEIKVSPRVSKNRMWLRDITVIKDKIYLLSELGMCYEFSNDLKIVRKFQIPRNVKFFGCYNGKTIQLIEDNGFCHYIDLEGNVLDNSKIKDFDFTSYSHCKSFVIKDSNKSSTVISELSSFRLNEIFTPIWEYYDGINLDFDEKVLVYFKVYDANKYQLFIYKK